MLKRCFFCKTTKRMTKHHIIPLSIGGTSKKKNKEYLCDRCHKKLHVLLTPVINYLIERSLIEKR